MNVPLISPCDLQLKINLFSPQDDQPDATLNIYKSQHIRKAVRDFMETHEIHSALTGPLLELVEGAIFDHMKSQVDLQVEQVLKSQNNELQYAAGGSDVNIVDSRSVFNIGEQASKLQENLERYTTEYTCSNDQDSFKVASNFLGTCKHSNILLQSLADLQFAYYQAVCDRTDNWNNQIMFITQQQQDEISAARVSGVDSEGISSRRHQTARDIDTLNKTRDSELEEMRQSQRKEYRHWILNLCKSYQDEPNKDISSISLHAIQTLMKNNGNISKELANISGYDQYKEATPKSSHSPIAPVVIVNEQEEEFVETDPKVKEIAAMGFDEPLARCALSMAQDDLQQAILLLLDSPDQVELKLKQLKEKSKSINNSHSNTRSSTPSSHRSNESQGRSRPKFLNDNSPFKNIKSSQDQKLSPKNNFLNMATSARNWLGKALDSLNSEDGRTSPSMPIYQTDSFVSVLGSHLRTPYQLSLTDEDPMSGDFTPEVLNQTLKALFKPKLTARLVLFHPAYFPNYHLGRVANGRLFSECSRLTELHFETIGEQLSSILNKTQTSDNIPQEGDFFITRHSNLSKIHLVIHMAVESSAGTLPDDLPQRPTLVSGLRSVLSTCMRYGISKIILPLDVDKVLQPLSQPTSLAQKLAASANKSNSNITTSLISNRRHESLFKCIKGLLIESTRTGALPYPTVISPTPIIALTFLLPPTDHIQFKSIQSQLQSVFKP